ncbi:SAV_915 family protein [Micromonospora sp. NPDC005237]|uniref:SAV_915 family protein n=1 Tax=Micromonospora sp. NPDC005237 TaxID=3155113 RepID=UPI0033B50E89
MDEAPIIFAVPVHDLPGRLVRTVRTGRSPQGQRVGIAFTRPELLVAAMGADQPWEELCEPALRGMLRPLGIDRIQVDPLLVAPPHDPSSGDRAAPTVPARAVSNLYPRPIRTDQLGHTDMWLSGTRTPRPAERICLINSNAAGHPISPCE